MVQYGPDHTIWSGPYFIPCNGTAHLTERQWSRRCLVEALRAVVHRSRGCRAHLVGNVVSGAGHPAARRSFPPSAQRQIFGSMAVVADRPGGDCRGPNYAATLRTFGRRKPPLLICVLRGSLRAGPAILGMDSRTQGEQSVGTSKACNASGRVRCGMYSRTKNPYSIVRLRWGKFGTKGRYK